MSVPSQSVFISYTREDLAAARRIADALSAFEVEVWFDEGGLEGGDAWDQKIRRQIKECSLFIPIISGQTQARREAYFRLEWKLAEERTHLMAEGTAFLLPIAIDGTLEAGALVPDSFLRTQWMRLPRGVPNTGFVDRVRALLEAQRRPPLADAQPAIARTGGRKYRGAWLLAAGLAMATALLVVFWPKPAPEKPSLAPAQAPPAKVDKSIAVLPFTNLSDDKENAFFADGVHEDILTNLANIADLKVIARTSVMEYRGTTKRIQQIAQELGVAYVLEGSVRRAGGRVRVVCQLIDGRTGQHVLAPDPYDRDLADIFAIQSELAKNIVAKLQAVISPREKIVLETVPTANLTAYDLYLKARQARMTEPNVRAAMERSQPLLESAIQYDPKFALAWLDLGITHLEAFNGFDASDARRAKAKEAFDQAERLEPNNPAILSFLGNYYIDVGDQAHALAQGQLLTRLFPDHAAVNLFLARLAWRVQGDDAQSLVHYRKAQVVDPRNQFIIERLCGTLVSYRRYDEAEALGRQTAGLPWDNVWQAYLMARVSFLARGSTEAVERFLATLSPEARHTDPFALRILSSWAVTRGDADGVIRIWEQGGADRNLLAVGAAFLVKGEPAKARPLLEKNRDKLKASLSTAPDHRFLWSDLALTQALLGDKAGVLEARQKMLDIPGPRGAHVVDEGVLHAWLGEKDLALAELAKELPGGEALNYSRNVHEMRRSLFLWPLQGDPRFEAILNDPKNNALRF